MSLLPFIATLAAGLWWLGAPPAAPRRRRLGGAALTVGLLALTWLSLPHPAMLEKLATRLALPAGALWLAGYLVVAACLRSGHRRAAAAALGGWLVYTAGGSMWLGGALMAGLERGVPTVAAATGPLDALAVLGGGTERGPDGAAHLSASGDRLRVAAAAWHRRLAPVVVVGGTSIAGLDQRDARDLGAESRGLLADMGVPPAAVESLPGAHNTATEIAALAARAREAGWTRVGLVTSAWHMPRALRLARGAGLPAVPIGADFRGRLAPPNAVGLVPSGSGFYHTQIALKEHLAGLVGR